MKLLHPVIEVVPGCRAQQPAAEGTVGERGQRLAVLRPAARTQQRPAAGTGHGACLRAAAGTRRLVPASGVGSVVASESGDVRPAPSERAVIYCRPPIPATLTGFFGALVQNGKGLLLGLIALVVAFNLAVLMFENVWRGSVIAEPLSSRVAADGQLTVAGKFLQGARVLINDKDAVEAKLGRPRGAENVLNAEARNLLTRISVNNRQYLTFTVPKQYDQQKIRLSVQRVGLLPFLGPLMPKYKCKTEVQVGWAAVAVKDPRPLAGGTVKRGAEFTIRDPVKALGQDPGTVLVGGEQGTLMGWKPDRIRVRIPREAGDGQLPVVVAMPDGRAFPAGTINIPVDAVQTAQGNTRGGAPSPLQPIPPMGGGGSGSGGGGGGGGSRTPAALPTIPPARPPVPQPQNPRPPAATRPQPQNPRPPVSTPSRPPSNPVTPPPSNPQPSRPPVTTPTVNPQLAQLRSERDTMRQQRDALKQQVDEERAAWQKQADVLDDRSAKLDNVFRQAKNEAAGINRSDAAAVAAYNRKVAQLQSDENDYRNDAATHREAQNKLNQKIRQLNQMAQDIADLEQRIRQLER